MDHQVSSSQSVISFDKSPASTFKPSHSRNNSTGSSKHSKQARNWEVMEEASSVPGSSLDLSIPGICEGYLMKRRKYPLKGWHKRYFLLERGVLKYSKTQQDVSQRKLHGSLDISMAVMSVNKKSKRIDLDAGDNLYHLKAKSSDIFYIWLTKLSAHRLFRKNEAMSVHRGVLHALSLSQPVVGTMTQQSLSTVSINYFFVFKNLFLEKPKKKSGKVGHSRTLSRVEAMGGMLYSSQLPHTNNSNMAASVQSIPDYVYSQLSNPQVTSPEAKKLHQDICMLSQRVYGSLKSIHEVLTMERERLRQAWTSPDLRQNTSHQLATLCTTLSELDMQSHLTKVHSVSLSSGSTEDSFCTVCTDQRTPSMARHSRRAPSVAESTAEYFDASEVIMCETSSEAEASDESGLSDITTTSNSEPEEGHFIAYLPFLSSNIPGRRTTLPSPCADNSHIGIMTILYNNIGKDLSRVSMPVALNEPLSLLQRLSEELEYSELLDIANNTDDPYQRMVYVAAFSISGYAWASWRNRYKPFNPVLGETYENHREDRGFYYISEQVSHHPPISACHAESENFTFWQDQRWKNKFWGKSVEIISSGLVNVTLPKYGDHYEWNKAVTCIHNVLSQQRWLEHYGEVVIRNTKSDECTCKMTFVKSRYWSSESSKNEIQGVVLDRAGEVVHRFGGFWHEGIFCDTMATPTCIWKPNVQPDDHFQYYGFSRYARELNEMTADLEFLLPPTDARFRPDQKLLEEGKVAEADKKKDQVEEKQRERRKEMAKRGEEHIPRFFRNVLDEAGREVWLYNGTYWKIRQDPGFSKTENLNLW
uniref:Oxysterol-binding protein n=1 Tax=Xiphophorus couchianus TaxID=32473 RepID=A0A3B5LTB2_9TELE